MRRHVLPLLIAATLFAAGCSDTSSTPKTAPQPTAVSGTVSILGNAPLEGQGELKIELVDVSKQPNSVVTSKTTPVSTLPAQFNLPFATTSIDANDLYVLNASLKDSQRSFVAPIQYPVLTDGNGSQVAVQLKPLPTPSETAMDGFDAIKARLGALKYSNGDQSEVGLSRGWQIFRDQSGHVVFVRELADAGSKGFTTTEMAYRDDKPWVVVQSVAPRRGQKPNLVERAGWDATGALVLRERLVGAHKSPLSDADAKALYDEAKAMLAKAGK